MDTTTEKPTNRIEQVFNRLQDEITDARGVATDKSTRSTIRGTWPFTLDVIQQTLTAYSDDERWALISAFRWCVDPEHPISLADFAARVKISDNTLYKIYRAKYVYQDEVITRDKKTNKEISREPHPKAGQLCPIPEGLIQNIYNFLSFEKKALAKGKTDLVQTPTLKLIDDFCTEIREAQHMGFIVGGSHIGKTWALINYADNHNHGRTIYVRLPAAASLRDILVVICERMNVSTHGDIPELKNRIRKGLTKGMLLILDECHLLAHTARPKQFFKIMEVIREFHDATKAGVILCFTNLDDVSAAKQKELQQCWRRAPRKLFLPDMPTIGDLTAILEHNGLEFPAPELKVTLAFDIGRGGKNHKEFIHEMPRQLVRQLAKDEALLAITERIRVAKQKARDARKPVSWNHFVEAHLEIAALDLSKEPQWN